MRSRRPTSPTLTISRLAECSVPPGALVARAYALLAFVRPLSSSSSSSALPTPNNQLLSLIPNVFQRQPRSLRGHFAHHVVILLDCADSGVSSLLRRRDSCPPDSFSSSESRLRDRSDDKRERYRPEVCCRIFAMVSALT